SMRSRRRAGVACHGPHPRWRLPRRRGRGRGTEPAPNLLQKSRHLGMVAPLLPFPKLGRVNLTEGQGSANITEKNGQQDVAVERDLRLGLDPSRGNRILRPEHHHTSRRVQDTLDDLIEWTAKSNFGIPPDRPPMRREEGGQSRRLG